MPKTHIVSPATIKGLWNNWAIGFGAIALVMFLSLFIPKTWLPIVIIAIAYLLMVNLRVESDKPKISSCHLITWASVIVLFWSGIIMFAINFVISKSLAGHIFDPQSFNPQHPYVCSLIIYPLAVVVCAFKLLKGHDLKYCRRCRARYGYYPKDGVIYTLYYRESRYQLRLMLSLSLLLTVVDYLYYFLFYINVNYNSPDKFFFIAMPIAIYILSLIYMSRRYMLMSDEIAEQFAGKPLRPLLTLVRYLIVADDKIYLGRNPEDLIDTPAKETISRVENLPVEKASADFADLSGLSDYETKFLYSDIGFGSGANMMHFAVFLPNQSKINKLDGKWYTLDEINRQLQEGNVSVLLTGEISRIYRMTMAWKTYDRDGYRLYPLKNYQPTFRIRDFKSWNVDYNDLHWLDVATNNEDRSFFRIRRFWRRNFKH